MRNRKPRRRKSKALMRKWRPVSELLGAIVDARMLDERGNVMTDAESAENYLNNNGAGLWRTSVDAQTGINMIRFFPIGGAIRMMDLTPDEKAKVNFGQKVPLKVLLSGLDALRQYLLEQGDKNDG